MPHMDGCMDRCTLLLHFLVGRQSSWYKDTHLGHEVTWLVLSTCCVSHANDRNAEVVQAGHSGMGGACGVDPNPGFPVIW